VSREATFAIQNENVTGITLWQFNDIKVGSSHRETCVRCWLGVSDGNVLTTPSIHGYESG
jgi:hypothetical protein